MEIKWKLQFECLERHADLTGQAWIISSLKSKGREVWVRDETTNEEVLEDSGRARFEMWPLIS